MAFIFLYVDIIIPSTTGGAIGGGVVLIVIAMYGTVIIGVKTSLALYYHCKWMFTERKLPNLIQDPSRKSQVDSYWRKH